MFLLVPKSRALMLCLKFLSLNFLTLKIIGIPRTSTKKRTLMWHRKPLEMDWQRRALPLRLTLKNDLDYI